MSSNVEKLRIYQKAVDFADLVTCLVESFPRGKYCIADQLSRAAVSIATNVAEGNGRRTPKDGKNLFVVARGSALECLLLLEIAKRRSLIQSDVQAELVEELEKISKMFLGLIGNSEPAQWRAGQKDSGGRESSRENSWGRGHPGQGALEIITKVSFRYCVPRQAQTSEFPQRSPRTRQTRPERGNGYVDTVDSELPRGHKRSLKLQVCP